MDKDFHARVLSLTSDYGAYFAADFSNNVMGQLKSSFPLDSDVHSQVVSDQLSNHGQIKITEGNDTAVARFLYECAEFALEHDMKEPASRETYDAIKQMDSIHHAEIQGIVYHSASLYQTTLDGATLSVIATDASEAITKIQQMSEARMTNSESGGRVHTFLWGLLSDGMWVNTAFSKAYEEKRIFRPGLELTAYHAKSAFDAAREVYQNLASFEMSKDEIAQNYAILSSHISEDTFALSAPLGNPPSVFDLAFSLGTLKVMINHWEHGLSNSRNMVEAVSQLSFFISSIDQMIHHGRDLDEETLNPGILSRLSAVSNSLSLCLVAFEALRETKYKNTLIFFVDGKGEDPTVDVMVNGDNLRAYQQAGGLDTDLAYMGLYLDPRRGQVISGYGHDVEWAINRRDEVVPEMISAESDRLGRLRQYDANSVARDIVSVMTDLVSSYLANDGINEIPQPMMLQIRKVANAVTSRDNSGDVDLESEIAMILARATNRPYIEKVATTFIDTARAHPGNDVRARTVATLAAQDALSIMQGTFE